MWLTVKIPIMVLVVHFIASAVYQRVQKRKAEPLGIWPFVMGLLWVWFIYALIQVMVMTPAEVTR